MTAYDGYGAIARVYDKLNAELDYSAWADFFEKIFDREMKSRPERQMSIAVKPAAKAPKTAEQRLTAHAGVGWPMYVTHENALQKNHEQSVQNGYPGGCGTPRCAAAVASSPESSKPTDGPSVKK